MADDSNFHLCIGRNSERFYIFLQSNFLMQISIYKKSLQIVIFFSLVPFRSAEIFLGEFFFSLSLIEDIS